MLHAQTFHATVAPDAISKVTRLFNASLDDIFAELIQNARRAGATVVSIDQVEDSTLGSAIRIADNGSGIQDPKSLFTLGQSAWDRATITAEDAAGMGFFALAGRRVCLVFQEAGTSRSWALDADPAAFKGEAPIICTAGPDNYSGATITFEARPNENLVASANRAALYCPVEVVVDGVIADRKDFLENADHTEVWKGIRIGLYESSPTAFRNHGNVNFHGVTLRTSLPSITQSFHRAYHARIDVIDCARLKLVLPARKEIVGDAFFETLKQQILHIMYQQIARSGVHSLSFSKWSEARALGVELPAAAMFLRPFSPNHADRDSSEVKSPVSVSSESLLLDGGDTPIHDQNLALALSGHDDAPTLCEPNAPFEGYPWYDALSRLAVVGYRLIRAAGDERLRQGENPSSGGRPDRLVIEGQISTASDCVLWELESDVLVLGPEEPCDLDEIDLRVTKASSVTHDDLVDLLTRSVFCASDDLDAGTYDDQLRWFTDRAEDLVIKLLESDHEANVNAVIRVISRELYWLKNRDTDVTIHIAGNRVSVTGLKPTAGVQL